ncbi:MAG: UDP-3-O-acyl-N-acetylglucosamine deacetylase [Polyangiaceae bacterium]
MTFEARGVALFSGEHALVRLSRCEGPTTLHTSQGGGALETWSPIDAFRTTALAHSSGARVACVEHLFAALAAYGAHEGVAIFVQGAELPILDGASLEWCMLLDELGVASSAPSLAIARDAKIEVGESTYSFAPGSHASVAVTIDLTRAGSFAASLPTGSYWNGTRVDFAEKIASARTFVLERDLASFAKKSEAHAPPESFVVIDETGAKTAGRAFDPQEPARHKLLDLLGDLFAFGGPPLGHIEATRPGHAQSREAVRLALAQGILTH